MRPTSWPSQVTVRWVMPGENLTLAMCASDAVPSSGSSGVNAAIRAASGSRLVEQFVEVGVRDRL
jgi:hypothetical protein